MVHQQFRTVVLAIALGALVCGCNSESDGASAPTADEPGFSADFTVGDGLVLDYFPQAAAAVCQGEYLYVTGVGIGSGVQTWAYVGFSNGAWRITEPGDELRIVGPGVGGGDSDYISDSNFWDLSLSEFTQDHVAGDFHASDPEKLWEIGNGHFYLPIQLFDDCDDCDICQYDYIKDY